MHEYFELKWPDNLWQLGGAKKKEPISRFLWHMDLPFWATSPPDSIFDLSPNMVLDGPCEFREHYLRIESADTQYPVIVCKFGNLDVILDGLHRLAKLVLSESKDIEYLTVPKNKLLRITQDI